MAELRRVGLFFGTMALMVIIIYFFAPKEVHAALPPDYGGRSTPIQVMGVPYVSTSMVVQPPAVHSQNALLRSKKCIVAKAAARRTFGVSTNLAVMQLMDKVFDYIDTVQEDGDSLMDLGAKVWNVQHYTAMKRFTAIEQVVKACRPPPQSIEVRR